MGQIGQFIINHWELWAILILVLFFIFINELLGQKKRAKELSPHAVVALLNEDNAVIIDLRDKDSYRNGHIINAINATPEDFEKQKMDKYKSKPLVLVCTKGLQSGALATKLRHAGYSHPVVLAGGISAWQNADLPLVKGK
ncbi:MAG: rhodanese-like domain-containing protein [Legionella sp.]|nr:rhodanese-like domain-containing protein [Legionella sp.]